MTKFIDVDVINYVKKTSQLHHKAGIPFLFAN